MTKTYKPRPYQPKITQHILDHPRCNIFASMGSGKSPATMAAIAYLLLFGDVQRVLVIGPKRVASSTWPEVVTDFGLSFGWVTMAVAVGTDEQRHAALRSGAMVTTINFENLEWLVDNYGADWLWDMVVVDESTKLRGLRVSIKTHPKSGKKYLSGAGTSGTKKDKKGSGSSRARALARVAHTRTKRWVNLTGTPTLAGLEALWGPQWFLDAGARLSTSFSAFSKRWFRTPPGSDTKNNVIEPMPHSESEIRRAVQDVTLVVDVRDYYDIKDPIENIIYVDMPPRAKAQYKEMATKLYTEINGHAIEAFSAGTKSQKLLQLASGAAYVDDQGSWELVHDEKIEALRSVIEEAAGMPVLVFYHFKSDLARILKAFPKARLLDDKPATQAAWNAGEIPLLAGHPAGMGHGLNLQHGSNICVFFSTNWSAENDAQAIERIGPTRQLQSGYDRPVFVHRLVARGTVEMNAVARLKSRISVQDALLAALKETQNCAQ